METLWEKAIKGAHVMASLNDTLSRIHEQKVRELQEAGEPCVELASIKAMASMITEAVNRIIEAKCPNDQK
jgi:hypothetical protein